MLCLIPAAAAWSESEAPRPPVLRDPKAPLLLAEVQRKTAAEFARLDVGLKRAAAALGEAGLTGDKARPILAELCGAFRSAVDCAAVDLDGRMATIEPAGFRFHEGKSIVGQEQVKRVRETRMPAFSNVFRAVEGFDAADAEYPVITPAGTFIGSVSLLFKPEALLRELIAPLVKGTSVDIWAMETGGRILYDFDTPQVGLNLFGAPLYRPYTELLRLGRRIAASPEGEGAYRFMRAPSKKEVTKRAFWQSVSLYGAEWRLVAVHVERE
jgi:hypothetical protein